MVLVAILFTSDLIIGVLNDINYLKWSEKMNNYMDFVKVEVTYIIFVEIDDITIIKFFVGAQKKEHDNLLWLNKMLVV